MSLAPVIRLEGLAPKGLLCAVASSQVHGDSSRDGSGRSLDSPEGQCSIGFQPVLRSHHRAAFSKFSPFFREVYKARVETPELRATASALDGAVEGVVDDIE
jgi:hypothetical protein